MLKEVRQAAEKVGSIRLLAKRLGVYRGSLYAWTKIPAEYVLEIEEITGGAVTRYQMRPDVFGKKPRRPDSREAAHG